MGRKDFTLQMIISMHNMHDMTSPFPDSPPEDKCRPQFLHLPMVSTILRLGMVTLGQVKLQTNLAEPLVEHNQVEEEDSLAA